MSIDKKVLIFGASGLIGRHIYNLFQTKSKSVIGTYYQQKRKGLVHFDMSTSSLDDLKINDVKYGIICSAVTSIDKCQDNPEYSHKINVKKTKEIIADLAKREIIPIFMSSGAVFDGVYGGYNEESKRNPVSLYGKQKVEIEDFMNLKIENYLIIRPGKVCDFDKLFSDWIMRYKKGDTILCADDEKLSFTSPDDLAQGIDLLMEKNSRGIYHINHPEHYSRFDLAVKFFKYQGIADAKIKGCSIDNFGNTKRAKNTFMDSSKFIKETGFSFSKIEDYFSL